MSKTFVAFLVNPPLVKNWFGGRSCNRSSKINAVIQKCSNGKLEADDENLILIFLEDHCANEAPSLIMIRLSS